MTLWGTAVLKWPLLHHVGLGSHWNLLREIRLGENWGGRVGLSGERKGHRMHLNLRGPVLSSGHLPSVQFQFPPPPGKPHYLLAVTLIAHCFSTASSQRWGPLLTGTGLSAGVAGLPPVKVSYGIRHYNNGSCQGSMPAPGTVSI